MIRCSIVIAAILIAACLCMPAANAAPMPDLRVVDVSSDGTWVDVTVVNEGDGAAGAFYVDLFLDSAAAPTAGQYGSPYKRVDSLAATSQTTVSLYAPSLSSARLIDVLLDTDQIVAEQDETDNLHATTLATLALGPVSEPEPSSSAPWAVAPAEQSLPSDVIVIPEVAVESALAQRWRDADVAPVPVDKLDMARDLSGLGNDSGSMGIAASYQSGGSGVLSFVGEVFVVVRNAAFDPSDPARILSDDFIIVTGQLSGETPWMAVAAEWVLAQAVADGVQGFPEIECPCPNSGSGNLGRNCEPTGTPPGGGTCELIDCSPVIEEIPDMVPPATGVEPVRVIAVGIDDGSVPAPADTRLGGLQDGGFPATRNAACKICNLIQCEDPAPPVTPDLAGTDPCREGIDIPPECLVMSSAPVPSACESYAGSLLIDRLICSVPDPPPECGERPHYCDYVAASEPGGPCDPNHEESLRSTVAVLASARGCHSGESTAICCGKDCICSGEMCIDCAGPSCVTFFRPSDLGDPTATTTSDGTPIKCYDYTISPHFEVPCPPEQPAPTPNPSTTSQPAATPAPTSTPNPTLPPKKLKDLNPLGDEQKRQDNPDDNAEDEVDGSVLVGMEPCWQYDSCPDDDPDPDEASKDGDPVLLSSGALYMSNLDLSYAGPVRSLSFERFYTSGSEGRGVLGSNWTHNWDTRVVPIHPHNAPGWVSPYCTLSAPLITCAFVQRGSGGRQLYTYDARQNVFMPPAGSGGTLMRSDRAVGQSAWVLREADGHLLVFNGDGYLTEDRDRFGNAFFVHYAPTAAGTAWQRYCHPNSPHYYAADGRLCPWLGWRLGEAARPPRQGWDDLTPLVFPDPAGATVSSEELAPQGHYASWLEEVHQQLGALWTAGVLPALPTGEHRLRPLRVNDALRREILFDYYDQADGLAAGLLERITGSGGLEVVYGYDAPPGLPGSLNERFLVSVSRNDALDASMVDVEAAAPHYLSFRYQWPAEGGESYEAQGPQRPVYPPADSYDEQVRMVFLHHFARTEGCTAQTDQLCVDIPDTFALEGDPCLSAAFVRNAYISRVADNIIGVSRGSAPGAMTVELESAYVADPWRVDDFDRVVAQRYGGSDAAGAASTVGDDLIAWQSNLPRFVFEYSAARPDGDGGDLTDDALPQLLRSRYPLEEAHSPHPFIQQDFVQPDPSVSANLYSPPVCNGDVLATDNGETLLGSCSFQTRWVTTALLPAWHRMHRWYELDGRPLGPAPAEPPPAHPQLKRSRLTCRQLSLAEARDPSHNELVSGQVDVDGELSYEPITAEDPISLGGRRRVEDNLRRICAWVKTTNQDGMQTWHGLSYRGHTLVEARVDETGEDPIIEEFLYNADGRLIERRRPDRGAAPWQPTAGYTRYAYESFEPDADAQGEVTAWGWGRRLNLVEREIVPASGSAPALDDAGQPVVQTARMAYFRYEPFYNQLRIAAEGTPEGGIHYCHRWDFGYQESASLEDSGVASYLSVMGLRLPSDPTPVCGSDLPLFYGADLNGDGVVSRISDGRGVVRTRSWDPSVGEAPPLGRQTLFVRAPHGLPLQIEDATGLRTRLAYYPVGSGLSDDAMFGDGEEPTLAELDVKNRGLLAVVEAERAAPWPAALGPAEGPCPHLPPAYGWLLPFDCLDVEAELGELGLAPDVISMILALDTSPVSLRTRSYSRLGRARLEWIDGRVSETTRDSNGRTLTHSQFPLETQFERDLLGRVSRATATQLPGGETLRQSRYFRDLEGRVTARCRDLEEGACDLAYAVAPVEGAIAADGTSLETFAYSAAGQLETAYDGEGGKTALEYDAFGRNTAVRRGAAAHGDDDRVRVFHFDDDDRIYRVDEDEAGLLNHSFSFDGFGKTYAGSDSRQTHFEVDYDLRGRILKVDQGPPGLPERTAEWEYDAHGNVVAQYQNGHALAELSRDAGGRAYRHHAEGLGLSYRTIDGAGRTLYARDPAGNVEVFAYDPFAFRVAHSLIRAGDGNERLTTSRVTYFNALGHPLAVEEIGEDGQRHAWSRTVNAVGDLLDASDPEGTFTTVSSNLMGWALEVSADAGGALTELTTFARDSRGRVTERIDPTGEVTGWSYNAHGDVTSRQLPGFAGGEARVWDAWGRLESHTYASGQTEQLEYDARGDLVNTWGPGGLLASFTYDELGRTTSSVRHNRALDGVVSGPTSVSQSYVRDDLDRVTSEGVTVGTLSTGVDATWNLEAGGWRRELTLPSGAVLDQYRDLAGRLDRIVAGESDIDIHRLGELVAGRSHAYDASAPDFVEEAQFDGLGRRQRWAYRPFELVADGSPVDPAFAATWCGGSYEEEDCGGPIFEVEVHRDVLGRQRSRMARFGHPLFESGKLQRDEDHRYQWRGYDYDGHGRLGTEWTYDATVASALDLSFLPDFDVDVLDVENFVAAEAPGSLEWTYLRDDGGDLEKLVDIDSGEQRWSHPVARGAGHRARTYSTNGEERDVTHDADGRADQLGDFDLEYDLAGRLAVVRKNGLLVEAYAYDAAGRLSAVYDAAGLQEIFVHDGSQMVASVSAAGDAHWEAIWGAQQDQLLEWRDQPPTGNRYIAVTDERHSVVAAYDAINQTVAELAEYDARGRTTLLAADETVICDEPGGDEVCSAPGAIPFAFTGAWRSTATGLVHLRARWYSPHLGEFLSPDPAGYVDAHSLYAYAGHDPINYVDPSGASRRGPGGGGGGGPSLEEVKEQLGRFLDPGNVLLDNQREALVLRLLEDHPVHGPAAREQRADTPGFYNALGQRLRMILNMVPRYGEIADHVDLYLRAKASGKTDGSVIAQLEAGEITVLEAAIELGPEPSLPGTRRARKARGKGGGGDGNKGGGGDRGNKGGDGDGGNGDGAPEGDKKTLFHYTDDAGLEGITSSKKLNPSLKANNPKDVRYGEGQYLSDIQPGTKTCAQLSRCFLGQPFQGTKFKNFIEIDVDGLPVKKGRDGVFVVPGDTPLDLTDRIVRTGSN